MPRVFNQPVVCLDTEVFVTEGFHFGSTKLTELQNLAVDEKIILIIPSVTVKECKKRIEKMVRGAKSALKDKDTRRDLIILQQTSIDCTFIKTLDASSLSSEVKTRFEQFLSDCKAEIFSDNSISAESILDAYFEGLPPFGQDQKKDQFPDAVAISALSNWQTAKNTPVHVISNDKDFRSAVKTNNNLIIYDGIAEFLDFYNKQEEEKAAEVMRMIEERKEQITRYITNEFPKLGFILLYEDGDIEDVSVEDVELGDPAILALHNEYAKVEVPVTVSYIAEATYEDPDTGWYDKEDGMYFGRETASDSLEREVTFNIELELSWDADNLDVDVHMGVRDVEVRLEDWPHHY